MKPLKNHPEKGLAAEVDDQWWLLESPNDFLKAVLLRKRYVSFYKDGLYHRSDGPAIIQADGSEEWHLKGKLHRTDGPAVIEANGTKEWHLNGELHRSDGPAVIRADGTEFWYKNDKLHRSDGPAVVWASGTEEWYQNGELVKHETLIPMKTTKKRKIR